MLLFACVIGVVSRSRRLGSPSSRCCSSLLTPSALHSRPHLSPPSPSSVMTVSVPVLGVGSHPRCCSAPVLGDGSRPRCCFRPGSRRWFSPSVQYAPVRGVGHPPRAPFSPPPSTRRRTQRVRRGNIALVLGVAPRPRPRGCSSTPGLNLGFVPLPSSSAEPLVVVAFAPVRFPSTDVVSRPCPTWQRSTLSHPRRFNSLSSRGYVYVPSFPGLVPP